MFPELHPQARAYLDRIAQLGLRPTEELTPAEARAQVEANAAELFGPAEKVARVEEVDADGIRLRVYDPSPGRSTPVLVWLHGGGWVVGSLDSHDGPCRALANRCGCRVASVDYRLAPEHRFPAAVEDAWIATCWVAHRAPQVAVGGDSAGGNLAAVVGLRARQAGLGLALQVLVYPVLDHDLWRPSYLAFGEGYGLTRAAMHWYWEQYLGGQDPSQPEASPLQAASLAGVAPALVVVCSHDPLHDEGVAYASRLRAEGVPARLSEYQGMVHGFLRTAALTDCTADLLDECAAAVREAFMLKT